MNGFNGDDYALPGLRIRSSGRPKILPRLWIEPGRLLAVASGTAVRYGGRECGTDQATIRLLRQSGKNPRVDCRASHMDLLYIDRRHVDQYRCHRGGYSVFFARGW